MDTLLTWRGAEVGAPLLNIFFIPLITTQKACFSFLPAFSPSSHWAAEPTGNKASGHLRSGWLYVGLFLEASRLADHTLYILALHWHPCFSASRALAHRGGWRTGGGAHSCEHRHLTGHQLQGRELACRSRGLSTVYNSRWHPWVLGVKQVERVESKPVNLGCTRVNGHPEAYSRSTC